MESKFDLVTTLMWASFISSTVSTVLWAYVVYTLVR